MKIFSKYRNYTIAIATIVTFVVNMLSVALPLNGLSTQELSAQNPTPLTPANYVFSIWSLIYLLLFAFTIWQWNKDEFRLNQLAPWYVLAAIANSAWIFAWHYQQLELSLIFMVTLLLALIQTYRITYSTRPQRFSISNWFSQIPFSIYLAWVSVATVINVIVVLNSWNIGNLGIANSIWAVGLLIIVALLGLAFLWQNQDIFFGLVLVWALVGIYQQNYGQAIEVGSVLVATSLFFVAVYQLLYDKQATNTEKI